MSDVTQVATAGGVAALANTLLQRAAANTPMLAHLRATDLTTYNALMGGALGVILQVLNAEHTTPPPRDEQRQQYPGGMLV